MIKEAFYFKFIFMTIILITLLLLQLYIDKEKAIDLVKNCVVVNLCYYTSFLDESCV